MSSKAFVPYYMVIASALTLTACQPGSPMMGKSSSEEVQSETKKSSENPAQPANEETKKISEALGNFIGRNLKSPGMEFDVDSLVIGIRNGATGKPSPMTDEEYEKAMLDLQQKAYNSVATTNMEAAEKFLQQNAKEEGIVVLEPGKLQYKILAEGKGPIVPEHGSPTINYTGHFIDGTVFGTTENGNGPITIPIDNTVPGFTKGVAGMKEGEKRRLFVHPDLGYGKGGQLPPNSLLIFDIEVVKAEPSPDEISMNEESKDDSDDSDDTDDLEENLDDDSESEETDIEPKKGKKDASEL